MRIIKGLLHTFTEGLSAPPPQKKAGLCGLRTLPDPSISWRHSYGSLRVELLSVESDSK